MSAGISHSNCQIFLKNSRFKKLRSKVFLRSLERQNRTNSLHICDFSSNHSIVKLLDLHHKNYDIKRSSGNFLDGMCADIRVNGIEKLQFNFNVLLFHPFACSKTFYKSNIGLLDAQTCI